MRSLSRAFVVQDIGKIPHSGFRNSVMKSVDMQFEQQNSVVAFMTQVKS